MHYAINLADLHCDHFEVTSPAAGERFQRVAIRRRDLMLGDRAYGTPPGVAHVCSVGGDVLVRIKLKMLPLFGDSGRALPILSKLRTLHVGEVRAWTAHVHSDAQTFRGRLVAIKRSAAATHRARKRLRRLASRQQKKLPQECWESARYVFVWTSLPEDEFSAEAVMELYRLRWQIELTFKRLKSLMGCGQVPKHNDASARAWLHGKLLLALLAERPLEEASVFSPCGYALDPSA